MRKSIGHSLIYHLGEQFPELSNGDYRRIFLWDAGHGYPDENGVIVPIDRIQRPFCLIQASDHESEKVSLNHNQTDIQDSYRVLVHLFCRPPDQASYEQETLPDSIKDFLTGRDLDFYDFTEEPPAYLDRAGSDRVVCTSTKNNEVSDPLFLYRWSLHLNFHFYRAI